MKTTDRLQEVHRQYEAMERAVKQLRELRDEVVRDLLTLRELLHSEAQERRKLIETLRGQWKLLFVVGRVPTRFVSKYTLRRGPETSGGHEAVEGTPGHAGDLGDSRLGDTQLEEAADLVLLAVEP